MTVDGLWPRLFALEGVLFNVNIQKYIFSEWIVYTDYNADAYFSMERVLKKLFKFFYPLSLPLLTPKTILSSWKFKYLTKPMAA